MAELIIGTAGYGAAIYMLVVTAYGVGKLADAPRGSADALRYLKGSVGAFGIAIMLTLGTHWFLKVAL